MIDSTDISTFSALLEDRRIPFAVLISVISGFLRGFSGFGSALIYIPVMSAIYDPRIATATLVVIDLVSGSPYAVKAFPRCTWNEVLPITFAALVATPIGAVALLVIDSTYIRLGAALVVGTVLVFNFMEWRYAGTPTLFKTTAVGLLSGFLGGAVQMEGPPVALFWLGGSNVASVVRANLMVFIVLNGVMVFISYLLLGLVTREVIVLWVILGPPFAAAMWGGTLLFQGASEASYRNVALLLVTAAVIGSLPIPDGWLSWIRFQP